VVAATAAAAAIAVLIGLLSIWWADAAPLCTTSGKVSTCPVLGHTTATGFDVVAVEVYGVQGAVLAVAFSLRRLRGTATHTESGWLKAS
jgi:hypothetical protein